MYCQTMYCMADHQQEQKFKKKHIHPGISEMNSGHRWDHYKRKKKKNAYITTEEGT